ncbi:MAG: hypothetical protein CBE33_04240 [Candidatus Pelagibacter sp. TMED273]|nr:MAG: hypothetical protein CBE33_04240 [Candidatus Pelagibacter sp. TMED273]|tara:strand:+ start:3233 stop:3640 length:408 start_codon:yes stop_codon:yes gene_type:complete
MSIVLKYFFFSSISIVVNISSQFLINYFILKNEFIYLSILFGTFNGLVLKFFLDKKFIFYFNSKSIYTIQKKFFLYSLTGVATTIFFWSVEILFHFLFSNPNSKYIGGILGLSIGYIIKYYLDKKFVFKRNFYEN